MSALLAWCRRMHVAAVAALWCALWVGLGLPPLRAATLACGLMAAGFAFVQEHKGR